MALSSSGQTAARHAYGPSHPPPIRRLLRRKLSHGGGTMPDRIATIIVLAEDQEHQNLVRRYLLRCGHGYRTFRFIPLPGNRGSGSQYVREHFPEQLGKCRETLGRRASCLLIVITDADNLTPAAREQTLHTELQQCGQPPVSTTEPVVVLIPKWQVETWIKCLIGQSVSENDKDIDRPPVDSSQIRIAALILYEWARPNAQPGVTCVASLASALPRWRRIG